MEEKQKNKKVIAISIISVVVVAIIGVVLFFVLNAEQLKLYNSTLELGQKNYLEEITKQENVYVKDGYTYEVKEDKIDINTAGIYELTFEIKGKGETIEETKKIQVVDTTPPTIELSKDTFYIGDTINIEEIIVIKDLSQEEAIPYAEANVKIEGQFDTSKEGESKILITATDKNGITGTQEVKIKVETPVMSIYDYIYKAINKYNAEDHYTEYSIDTSSGKFTIKYNNGSSNKGWVNYTDKIHYDYLSTGGLTFTDTSYFNNNCKVTKLVSTGIFGEKETYTSGSELKEAQTNLESELKDIKSMLNDKNDKIKLVGKTVEQLKKETIDVRTLK